MGIWPAERSAPVLNRLEGGAAWQQQSGAPRLGCVVALTVDQRQPHGVSGQSAALLHSASPAMPNPRPLPHNTTKTRTERQPLRRRARGDIRDSMTDTR